MYDIYKHSHMFLMYKHKVKLYKSHRFTATLKDAHLSDCLYICTWRVCSHVESHDDKWRCFNVWCLLISWRCVFVCVCVSLTHQSIIRINLGNQPCSRTFTSFPPSAPPFTHRAEISGVTMIFHAFLSMWSQHEMMSELW